MNITTEVEDAKLTATVTIPAADVDAAIKQAYKDVAKKYRFPGFRPGHAPRPVIDSALGAEATLAQATNDLLNAKEGSVLEELDIVPVKDPEYKDVEVCKDHEDYVYSIEFALRPTPELSSYDPVEINMPPEEVTEAEIDQQVNQLMSYQATFEETDRGIEPTDFISLNIKDVQNAADIAGDDRMVILNSGLLPEVFDTELLGMKTGETKTITWMTASPLAKVESEGSEAAEEESEEAAEAEAEEAEEEAAEAAAEETAAEAPAEESEAAAEEQAEEEAPEQVEAIAEVTITKVQERHVPELTDELAKNSFGFNTVEEMRYAVQEEIESEKASQFPQLKENRVVAAITERLQLDEMDPDYEQSVFQDVAQNFLQNLSRQGMDLDTYLQQNGMSGEDFINQLHAQSEELARESLALDALARNLDVEVTQEDIDKEFENARIEDIAASEAQYLADGQMPAIRDSIRRSKAIDWLVDNAIVTVVDEAAEANAAYAAEVGEEIAEEEAAEEAEAEEAETEAPAEEAAEPAAEEEPAVESAPEPVAEPEEEPATATEVEAATAPEEVPASDAAPEPETAEDVPAAE